MTRRRDEDGRGGVLLVDKPAGPTSFDVVQKVRRAMGMRRVGHAGTLDPAATGLLVILLGPYTRLSPYLTADEKSYRAEITFGTRTDTDDAEGAVVEEGDPSALQPDAVRAALLAFLGPQQQLPPNYAAIRVDGVRMHQRARAGEEVVRTPRSVVFHAFDDVTFQNPRLSLHVRCSKGTYIRALARDLGAHLSVPAHLSALRRIASGPLLLQDALTLDAVRADPAAAWARVRTDVDSLPGVPVVRLDADEVGRLRNGQRLVRADTADADVAWAASSDHHLVAVVRVQKGQVEPLRVFPPRPAIDPAAASL